MTTVSTEARAPRTADLLSIARRYAADPDQWPFAPRFDPRQRWYGRLAERPDHEVWLLTWLPGQTTDLHDHGGSAGAFVVISGTLIEQTVAAGSDDRMRGARSDQTAAGRGDQAGATRDDSGATRGDLTGVDWSGQPVDRRNDQATARRNGRIGTGQSGLDVDGRAARTLADAVLPAGSSRQFGPHHIHRLLNAGQTRAVSVHVYGPALRTMTRYRLDRGELSIESVTRAGADW